MSRVIANAYRHTAASADAITLDSSGNVTFPANATCSGTATGFGGGKILQVVQAYKTDTFSASLSVGAFSSAVLTQSITPASASNKILVLCTLHVATGSGTSGCGAKLQRDGSDIGLADADGNRARGVGAGIGSGVSSRVQSNIQMTFLDSPNSTSALSYTAHIKTGYNGTQNVFLNREQGDSNLSSVTRPTSSLTLMEIEA
jgi:hypothetical protein|tara:strand:- start:526 stop:1131 length:606 start_codon:yes stop_codon:yes gene_type:complete